VCAGRSSGTLAHARACFRLRRPSCSHAFFLFSLTLSRALARAFSLVLSRWCSLLPSLVLRNRLCSHLCSRSRSRSCSCPCSPVLACALSLSLRFHRGISAVSPCPSRYLRGISMFGAASPQDLRVRRGISVAVSVLCLSLVVSPVCLYRLGPDSRELSLDTLDHSRCSHCVGSEAHCLLSFLCPLRLYHLVQSSGNPARPVRRGAVARGRRRSTRGPGRAGISVSVVLCLPCRFSALCVSTGLVQSCVWKSGPTGAARSRCARETQERPASAKSARQGRRGRRVTRGVGRTRLLARVVRERRSPTSFWSCRGGCEPWCASGCTGRS